jgi:hypothetical protein
MRALTSLSLLLLAAGCGGGAVVSNGSSLPHGGVCTVQSRWTAGELRSPDGSFAYASVSDADTTVDLTATPLRVHVVVDGFTLEGSLDATSELRIVPPTALGRVVLLPPGAHVTWLGFESDHVRIGLGRFSFDEHDGIAWVVPPTTTVPCSALGLSFALRDDESERRERLALGLPLDPPTRWIPAGSSVAISPDPGAPAEVVLTAHDAALAVLVIGEQPGYARIAQQHWTGATLVGWVDADALVSEEPAGDAYGMGGLLGALAGPQTIDTCFASETLPVSVRQIATVDDEGNRVPLAVPAAAIPVGWLEAGARFVRRETRADGTIVFTPHTHGHVSATSEAEWLVPASATLTCVEERVDPSSVFAVD